MIVLSAPTSPAASIAGAAPVTAALKESNTGAQNDAAWAAAKTAAGTTFPIELPSGTFSMDSTMTWAVPNPVLYAGETTLNFASNTTDGMVLGDGTYNTYLGSGGALRAGRLRIVGPSVRPSNFSVGFKVNGVTGFKGENITVSGWGIGFDFINNSGGSELTNCWAPYAENTLGMYLRVGAQSGSDLSFRNCWIHGALGGVAIQSGGNGFHFYGGQINSNAAYVLGTDDLRGSVVIGLDWDTGDGTLATKTIGTSLAGIATFDNVDFEGGRGGWIFRTFVGFQLKVSGSAFLAVAGTTPAIGTRALGVMRMTNPRSAQVEFSSNRIKGYFESTALIVRDGTVNSTFQFTELNTLGLAGTFISGVNGDADLNTDWLTTSLCRYSGLSSQYLATSANVVDIAGLMLRSNTGQVETSANGTSWNPLTASVQARVAATVEIALGTSAPSVVDGVTLAVGDRVLAPYQSGGLTNGVFVYNGPGVAMTRATVLNNSGKLKGGTLVSVSEGTVNGGSLWMQTSKGNPVLNTDQITYVKMPTVDTVGSAANTTRRFIPATNMTQRAGTATLGNVASRYTAYSLADAATNGVSAMTDLPDDWTTFNVVAHWSAGATPVAGDVALQGYYEPYVPGDVANADEVAGSQVLGTVNGTANVIQTTTLLTGVSAATDFVNLRVNRVGGAAGDTSTSAVLLVGIELVKAS